MLFYTLFLIITLSLTFALNAIFKVDVWYLCLLFVFISFVFEFVLDAILALGLRRLVPQKWIKPEGFYFRTHKFEKGLYEKLGIKKWKGWVPELGGFTDLHKSELASTEDSQYLHRFIIESCYGELIHRMSCLFSFTLLFLGIIKPNMLWSLFLPCCFINLFCNLLPAMIQRYVRPRLEVLYKRAKKNEERNARKALERETHE